MSDCGALAAAAVPAGAARPQQLRPGMAGCMVLTTTGPRLWAVPSRVNISQPGLQQLGNLRGLRWQAGDPTVCSMLEALQSGCPTHFLRAAATVTAMPSGDGSAVCLRAEGERTNYSTGWWVSM